MTERVKNTRNVLIIFGIGAAVYFIPGGGRVAATVEAALWTLFAIAIAYLALRMYREHNLALHSLGDNYRGLLYGAVAVAFFLWAVRPRIWYTLQFHGSELAQVHRWSGFGEVLWFALLAGVIYSLVLVYRHARSY